ncbi:MAG: 6-phosphogluconolactonase [Rhodocyclaceae bacterium]|nr:6-phosphogluconolactonase [Rhodocyclaceae bacterium]
MATLNPNVAPQQSRWHVFATVGELEDAAIAHILAAAHEAIATRGAFHLVLAGGTTPRYVYEALRAEQADWRNWHIYFGDERCLPPQHPERNSRMATVAWLAHVPIPAAQIHAIPAELGAEEAAQAYAETLKNVPHFDLVLLGLGEDGHTASLFPMQEWERAISWPPVLPVHDAPKPPPDRVSLSPDRLSASRATLFLISGTAKADAVRDWRDGVAIPASRVSAQGQVDIYLDSEVAREAGMN